MNCVPVGNFLLLYVFHKVSVKNTVVCWHKCTTILRNTTKEHSKEAAEKSCWNDEQTLKLQTDVTNDVMLTVDVIGAMSLKRVK